MQGLELRRAILETVRDHEDAGNPAPVRQDHLAKQLRVPEERLEAHFTFLEKAGHVSFLHMPGPSGERMRFITITDAGRDYLADASNFTAKRAQTGPFKVVEKSSEEKLATTFPDLRAYIERTEWVLDEEKPDIQAKVDELEGVLDEDFDPAKLSDLKLWFERHRWLAPHVGALIKAKVGF